MSRKIEGISINAVNKMLVEAPVAIVSTLPNGEMSTLYKMRERSVTLEAGNALPPMMAQGMEAMIKA